MASTINITNIPAPRVDVIDPRTGLMSAVWYRFFYNIFVLVGNGSNQISLEDLQVGPPNIDQFIIDVEGPNINTQALVSSLESQIAELVKEVQAAELSAEAAVNTLQAEIMNLATDVQAAELSAEAAVNTLQAEIMNLATDVQALAVTPPVLPSLKRARYGSFYDTTTQTATVINTATAITFNTTSLSKGVYLGSPTSRVYVDTEGVYNYQISIQLDKTSGGTAEFYIWFRLNGVDVADSASQIRIQGNDAEIFSALNYLFDLKAGDYVELMFSVTDLSVELLAVAAAAPHPGIPSIILTVSNNIN